MGGGYGGGGGGQGGIEGFHGRLASEEGACASEDPVLPVFEMLDERVASDHTCEQTLGR